MSGIGALQQGQAAYEAGRYNQAVSEQQARLLEQRARIEAEEERRRGRSLVARQRSRAAAAGVQVSEGSVVDLAADTAAEAEWRAQLAEWEGKVGAQGFRQRGELDRFAGARARTGSYFSAASTLFGSAVRGFDLLRPKETNPAARHDIGGSAPSVVRYPYGGT
jgi:hypothetical protein